LEDASKKRGALLENIIIKGIEYRVKHVGAVLRRGGYGTDNQRTAEPTDL